MNKNSFAFTLGNYKCLVVSDGTLIVPPPASEKSQSSGGVLPGEEMEVLSLVIDTGKQKILIDTGCGEKFQGTDTGKLVNNLNAVGINCQDIDIIVFTHGHLDHVAGTFDKSGKAVFPNARYFVTKKEWQCWVDRKERKELQMMFISARQDLLPIPQQFQLLNEGDEVIPGIQLTSAPGHTPGSTIIRVSSGGETLTCVGDLIHSAREFKIPGYYGFLDTDPEQAILRRDEVLSKLAESGEMAFVCHFPFPGLGYLNKKGQTLSWKAR
jgi:glyoxylase-like metal-dependent hydrolase (beta-lactamase superfamily II)